MSCIRCGIQKGDEKGRPLCRDCYSVLTKREVAIWKDAAPAVESYHEKEVA